MYIDLIIKEEVNIVCGEAIVGLSLMFTSVFAGCYCSGPPAVRRRWRFSCYNICGKSIFSNTDTDSQSQRLTGHGQPHQQPHGGDDRGGGDEGEVSDGLQEELVQPRA